MTDYYKILGISRTAGIGEVKRAFRQKAKEFHPDINPDPGAHVHFTMINEAYEILSDINKRYLYNLRNIEAIKKSPRSMEFEYWVKYARERANVHSKMPYEDFKKTPFYRTAARISSTLFVFAFLLGIFFLIYPFYNYITSQDPNTLFSFLVCFPIAFCAIVQAWIGYYTE